jgi:N-methylhydantoinase B/oxoprolinase/acetone carboxylase alpha subunit
VFCDGELVAFAESWAHFNDIGGMRRLAVARLRGNLQEGIIVPAGAARSRRAFSTMSCCTSSS